MAKTPTQDTLELRGYRDEDGHRYYVVIVIDGGEHNLAVLSLPEVDTAAAEARTAEQAATPASPQPPALVSPPQPPV